MAPAAKSRSSQGSALRIALFGQPHVVSADGSRDFPLPRKTLNVLAYLILKSKRAPTRDAVAFALFPDEDEEKARGSLRRNLSYLLSSLPPPEGGESFVLSDAERVSWNPAAPAHVDVLAFERAIAEKRDDDALAEYGGPLLPTLYDEWTTADRERLRDLAHDALARTIARDRSLRRFDAATAAAHRLLEDEPWREDIVRELIAVRYEAGDRAGALATFSGFAARLREELGAEPMDETSALREAILRGARLATSEPMAEKRAPVIAALPFVGRDEALLRAIERWHTSADGRAGALFLAGEAGIGKSRFTAELARAIEREGGLTIIGETAAGGERRPYEAVIEALRYASPVRTGKGAQRDDSWRTLVDRLLDEHAQATLSDDRSARVRLFDSIQKAVLNLARARPLAIVVEDLHWAGAATIDLLGYLIDRLANAPVLIVGTYRDDELPPAHPLRSLVRDAERAGRAKRLALNRLQLSDAVRAATEAAPPDVTAGALEAAVAWSEGVPLLLSEAVQDLAAGRAFSAGAFLTIIGERFTGLGQDSQTALTYAAVIGARFELETLAAASGWRDDEIVDALAPAIELGLVRAGRRGRGLTFAFSHHLVHAAMVERIADADRVRVHALTARAIRAQYAGGDRALEIAQHYAAAGEARRAAEQYAAGARYALDLFANVDSRDAATAGFALTRDTPADRELRYQLIETRERALTRIGAPVERRADAMLLCELAADDEARCKALERLVEALRNDKPAQRDALERLDGLAKSSARAAAIYNRAVATEASLDGDNRTAAAFALRASQQFDAIGDRSASVRVRFLHVNALTFLGKVAEAQASITAIRPEAENCEDPVLRMEFFECSGTIGADGRHELAFADAERALELALLIGDRYAEAQARHNVGCGAENLGEGARAVREYERAMQIYADLGERSGAARTIYNLAGLRGWAGDFAGAFQLLDQFDALEDDQPFIVMQSQAHRGAVYFRSGDFKAADRHLRKAREIALEVGHSRYAAMADALLGEIVARCGRFAEACLELTAAGAELERLGSILAAAEVHAVSARVHAEMHDEPAARALISTAAACEGRMTGIRLSAKAWWDLAAASACLGDDAAAHEFAESAARVFCDETIAMDPDLAETYARLPWHVDTFAYLAGREVTFTLAG